jgi:1,4-alpha-glucan branching enzyme
MKHNKNHHNLPSAGPQLVPVRFEFIHPTAASVSVAGCFNQWKPEAKSLHPTSTGLWFKETALRPGTYEYCFVVDGQWIADPQARDYVPNPYGGRNSVLKVASAPDTEPLPLKM